MEFKGTKGEWKIGANSILETEVVCGRIRVAQAKHYNTDNTGFFKHDPTIDEGHANAQLIAAAPELLEALQSLLGQLDNEHLSEFCNQYIEKSKQAINKALGL